MKKSRLKDQEVLLSSLLFFALNEIFYLQRVKKKHTDFLLCYLSGMSNKETAFVMQINERAVKNNWSYLMSKKRKAYRDKLFTKIDLLRICLYEAKGIELNQMLLPKTIKKTLPKQDDILILPVGAQ